MSGTYKHTSLHQPMLLRIKYKYGIHEL